MPKCTKNCIISHINYLNFLMCTNLVEIVTSTLHSRLLKCGSDGEAAISWESISGRAGPYTTLQTSEANSSGNLKYSILHLNIFKMMA